VEATGDVRHLIVRAEAPAASRPAAAAAAHNPAEPRKPAPVNIKSSRMVYLNAESSAHYTGKTVLETRDVRIESESLDAVFAADGKQVERAAARGTVHVRQTDRDVHGEMADYYLAPGKFVVTGKPAQIIDPKKGKSSAARLTFFTSDEKILLETR